MDFDRRAEDKTTSNILILGNSGQGKSYLLKLILTNIRESGKRVICLDPESEYEELSQALGGCYIDFMSGQYTINPLEPKTWSDGTEEMDLTAPDAFKKVTRLSQHIAFLKDFFRAYKDFNDAQIDTIEILLSKLYARFGITDSTDYSTKRPTDFPIMEDFYKLCEEEFYGYDKQRKYLYTEEILQEVCLFNKAQEESARRKAKAPVSQKSAMTASGKYSKYALTEVMICGECGSRYKRVTWNIRGKRRIVWRCISRLDYGKKYCTESITVDEQALQRAIVRALNRFNVEDEATYLLLMKSTIGEAVGINGSSDEIDLLERRIDALNKRMLDLVSLSVQEGDDAENHEDDFKNISTQIEQLTKRITAIRESESENGDFQARLKEIQDIIDKRRENKDIYDDSIVRQMVECIKVYHDGRLQIILGGGYELEEYLEK